MPSETLPGAASFGHPQRLTQAQRNKRERAKRHAALLQQQSGAKELTKQLGKLGQIAKEVGDQLSEQELRNARRAVQRSEDELKPQRLGKHKFTEVPLATLVPFTDELRGSLRTAIPKGSLLQDRLKSLEKRNVVEPRMKLGKRRRYVLRQYTTKAGKRDDAG